MIGLTHPALGLALLDRDWLISLHSHAEFLLPVLVSPFALLSSVPIGYSGYKIMPRKRCFLLAESVPLVAVYDQSK